MNKDLLRVFAAVLSVCLLPSCRSLIVPVILNNTRSVGWVHRYECRNDTLPKRVYFLGMQHIGKPVYFEDARRRIDSLTSAGYVVFYEGVGFPKGMAPDSASLDTIFRKFRKVTEVYVTDYLDRENKSIRKPYNVRKYVHQTNALLGIDTGSRACIHADMSYSELISQYERDKGEIRLSEYDWRTPLLAKYNRRRSKVPGDTTEYDSSYMIDRLRERRLYEMIRDSHEDKILVVYGGGHRWGLYRLLQDSLGMKADFARQYEADQKAKAAMKAAGRASRGHKSLI